MVEVADIQAATALLTLHKECNPECSISDGSEDSDSLSDFLAPESDDSIIFDEKSSNYNDDNDDISRCSFIISWSVTSKDVGVKIDADRQAHTDDPVEAKYHSNPPIAIDH
eukprot:419281-Ditylum_brightwellii.AAC.1